MSFFVLCYFYLALAANTDFPVARLASVSISIDAVEAKIVAF